ALFVVIKLIAVMQPPIPVAGNSLTAPIVIIITAIPHHVHAAVVGDAGFNTLHTTAIIIGILPVEVGTTSITHDTISGDLALSFESVSHDGVVIFVFETATGFNLTEITFLFILF